MGIAISQTRRIKDRKKLVNTNKNAKIKMLQRLLVKLSFTTGNNTEEYFRTLGKIKAIRAKE